MRGDRFGESTPRRPAAPRHISRRIGATTRSSQAPCNANRAGSASRNAVLRVSAQISTQVSTHLSTRVSTRVSTSVRTGMQVLGQHGSDRVGTALRFGGRAVQCSSRLPLRRREAANTEPPDISSRGRRTVRRSTDAAVHFFSRCRNVCDRLRPGV